MRLQHEMVKLIPYPMKKLLGTQNLLRPLYFRLSKELYRGKFRVLIITGALDLIQTSPCSCHDEFTGKTRHDEAPDDRIKGRWRLGDSFLACASKLTPLISFAP